MKFKNKRLQRIADEINRRDREFWAIFSDREIDLLIKNDPDTLAKIERLGGHKISELHFAILSPEEQAELVRFEKILSEDPDHEFQVEKGADGKVYLV